MATEAKTAPTKDVAYYLALPYRFEVYQESNDDGSYWVARVPELRWCAGDGATPEAAVACAKVSMEAWITSALEDGAEVPEPGSGFPDKFTLRVSRTLHRDLVGRSEREGVSLNAWCAQVLAKYGA